MIQSNTSIQTFEFAQNQLIDLGISSIGRQKAANKYGINLRDFRQLFINVSQIEPRKQMIIVSISILRCIITHNKIHILSDKESNKFIKQFPNLFAQSDSFTDFELKCLESILFFANEEFQIKINRISKNIKKISILTIVTTIAEYQHQITQLSNDLSRAIDAINLLIDEEEDIVALSFKNQAKMHQYAKSSNIPLPFEQLHLFVELSESSSESTSLHIDFELPAQQISEFLDSYLYQQHSLQIESQSLQIQIKSILEIRQIKMAQLRNRIEMFSVFMEVVLAVLAIVNMIGVTFGSNLINPWSTPSPEGGIFTNPTKNTPYQVICWILFIGAVIYIGFCWVYFYTQQKQKR